MSKMKDASFALLIILVGISATYEWVSADPVLSGSTNFVPSSDFNVSNILNDVNALGFVAESDIETEERTDLLSYIGSLIGGAVEAAEGAAATAGAFTAAFALAMKMVFGWALLINAIFTAMDIPSLSFIFIPPIAVIQLLGITYFIRDIVNTVRGVG